VRPLIRLIAIAVVAVIAVVWWSTSGESRDFLGELQARNPTILNLDLGPDAVKLEEDLLLTGKGEVLGKPSTSSVIQRFTVADGVAVEDVAAALAQRGRSAGFDMKTLSRGRYSGSNQIGDVLHVRPSSSGRSVSFTLNDTPASARASERA